jgi:hypothetical protein
MCSRSRAILFSAGGKTKPTSVSDSKNMNEIKANQTIAAIEKLGSDRCDLSVPFFVFET